MADEVEKAGTGRGVRIALALSLAVNLLIVGLVAGAMLSGGPPGRTDRAAEGSEPRGGPYLNALSEEDKRATRRALRQKSRDLRPSRADEREQAQAFLAALRADPFDPKGFQTVFQAQQDRALKRLGVAQSVLLGRIGEMSVEERNAYADRIEKLLERRKRILRRFD